MARDDNRGPLSRLRDLRGRLASWPAAPLHDHPETAGALGSAPADAVTPSRSDSLAKLVENTAPAPLPGEAETTVIPVDGAAAPGPEDSDDTGAAPSDVGTPVQPAAERAPLDEDAPAETEDDAGDEGEDEGEAEDPAESDTVDQSEADADASSDDSATEDADEGPTEGGEAVDGAAASPLRTVGPVVTTSPGADDTETTVLPTVQRPSADETTAIPVQARPTGTPAESEAGTQREASAEESSAPADATAAEEPATDQVAATEPQSDGADEPVSAESADTDTEAPAAADENVDDADGPEDESGEAATTAIPTAARPDQATIDTEQNELPDATPATEAIPVAPLAAPAAAGADLTKPEPPQESAARQSPEYYARSGGQDAPSKGKRTLWIVAAALVAIVVIVAAIALLVPKSGSGTSSDPRQQAATATTSFIDAVNRGDLTALREQTCGGAKAYYDGLNEGQWQRVHANAKADGLLPELDGLQAVDVRGDRAEVQVEVHYANDPSAKVRNTLTLEKDADTWKVCTRVGAR